MNTEIPQNIHQPNTVTNVSSENNIVDSSSSPLSMYVKILIVVVFALVGVIAVFGYMLFFKGQSATTISQSNTVPTVIPTNNDAKATTDDFSSLLTQTLTSDVFDYYDITESFPYQSFSIQIPANAVLDDPNVPNNLSYHFDHEGTNYWFVVNRPLAADAGEGVAMEIVSEEELIFPAGNLRKTVYRGYTFFEEALYTPEELESARAQFESKEWFDVTYSMKSAELYNNQAFFTISSHTQSRDEVEKISLVLEAMLQTLQLVRKE